MKTKLFSSSFWLLTSGLFLFIFSNGHWIVPIAAWIAPVLILRFIRDQKPLWSLPLLLLLFTFASGLMLYGIIPGGLGALTYILIFYYAFLWWLPYVVDKFLATRLKGFVSTFIFPMATVTVEFINTTLFGSWAATAYSQYEHLALIQLSSITGIWGVSFIVSWLASVTNWSFENHDNWSKVRLGVGMYTLILFLVLFYGGFRLSVLPVASISVQIASFTPQAQIDTYYNALQQRGFRSTIQMASEARDSLSPLLDMIHSQMFQRNEAIIGPDTRISLWPEGTISVLKEEEAVFLEKGKILARKKEIYLLLGYVTVPEVNPGILRENKAVLIDPSGQIVFEYLKANATPGSTDKEGDGQIPIADTPFGRLSTAICYDMDFTGLIHQAGKANVDIMLVPAWDWKDIDPLHTRMAVFRAIENGFSMVRQTGQGLSAAVDYQGRVLASMDHFTTNDFTMIAQVPTRGVKTVYSVIGDLLAWLSMLGLLFIWLLTTIKKDKTQH